MNDTKLIQQIAAFCDKVTATAVDRWSGQNTPMFADGFDVTTGQPIPWAWGGQDRVISNLANQQNLMRTLVGLSSLTGDHRFHDQALAATRHVLQHTAEANTGLLYWGGHATWDLARNEPSTADPTPGSKFVGVHELKRHYPYYELLWEADPEVTRRYVRAFWNAHLYRWDRLDFGRHGPYGKPGVGNEVWDQPYTGSETFFISPGLGFVNTGSDMVYAAAMLGHLSGDKRPTTWATRLAGRYAETRDPNTGLVGYQYSQSDNDRGQKQFGPEFGPNVLEGTILGNGTVRTRYGSFALIQMLLARKLGQAGQVFGQWAHEDLTALAKTAYDWETDLFIPMLTDGRRMTPEDVKRPGYYSPTSFVPAKLPALFFRCYVMAWCQTHDPLMWDMARRLGQVHGLGDIGASPGGSAADQPALRLPGLSQGGGRTGGFDYASMDHLELLEGLLELHGTTGRAQYLELAVTLGGQIMDEKYRDGLFYPEDGRRFVRIAPREPLALLSLAAAMQGRLVDVPADPASACYYTAEFQGHPLSEASRWNRVDDNQAVYIVKQGQEVPSTIK